MRVAEEMRAGLCFNKCRTAFARQPVKFVRGGDTPEILFSGFRKYLGKAPLFYKKQMLDETFQNSRKIAKSESAHVGTLNRAGSSFEKRTKHSLLNSHPGGASSNQILAAAAHTHNFDSLKPHLEPVSLRRGAAPLCAAGERSDYVYFPETAVISHLYNLADGNTIEIAMVGADGATGINSLFSSQPPTHQTSVIVDGDAQRVRADVLRQEFARGGKLQTLLLDYFNAYLAQISQRVACTSFHLTEKRFCSWLLMVQDRMRKNQLKLTQEQMAQLLGVNCPSLSRIAKKLSEKRLINYERGNFHILDRRGLETVACECYSVAQRNFQISLRSAERK